MPRDFGRATAHERLHCAVGRRLRARWPHVGALPYDAAVDAVEFFASRFAAAGDPAIAAAQKAYMKSALAFHGVTIAPIRSASRELAAEIATHAELRRAVDALYASDWFDLHSAAVALLERQLALVGPRDAAWLIGLVRTSACWAHNDWLSTKIIPAALPADPAPLLRKWAGDSDFWVRRASLLAQLDAMRAGGGDFELFAELAAPMLEEKEFFIRKAIGWVLRDVSKKRPDIVAKFVRKHHARMSGLTRREATRRLPAALQKSLLDL
jgi:3-methyladenine DNA glycosylase AlkD